MKRFHVHLNVDALDSNVAFYSNLFGQAPSVLKNDYAKWMLDEPRVNFAISAHGRKAGVDHLGIQVESEAELDKLGQRLRAADAIAKAEIGTTCCYANSDKYWAVDPQGTMWESFLTHGQAPKYYGDASGAQCEGTSCFLADPVGETIAYMQNTKVDCCDKKAVPNEAQHVTLNAVVPSASQSCCGPKTACCN